MRQIRSGMVLYNAVSERRETIGLDQMRGRKKRARDESAGVQDADSQLMLGRLLGFANGELESPEKGAGPGDELVVIVDGPA